MTTESPAGHPGSANRVDGEMSGVQAQNVHGDIQINSADVLARPALKLRRATAEELLQVREHFIPPGGYDIAARRLSSDEPVVVLCGPDTGRHYTATRLLVEHGSSAVVDLNRERSLDSLASKDLEDGEGYIWDVSGGGGTACTEWEWRHARRLLCEARCALVIIVDHRNEVPAELAQIVALTPPDPVEVAAATLRRRGDAVEEAIRIVKNDLADVLGTGTSPSKAVWAARLATEVQTGELTVEEARETLDNGVEHAVAETCEGLSTASYAMLMAVAVLENQPYDEVARLATELDILIRSAELPADKKLWPRKVFATTKNELLAAVCAEVVLRDHPEHTGLKEETVRFVRQGWANAVLRRIWLQYHVLQPIVLSWMGRPTTFLRFGGECALALSRVITTVPAHAPLGITDQLANASVAKRYLAATTLAHIAGQPGHRHLVEKQLENWITRGTAGQRATAAYLCGTRYSKGNVTQALAHLDRIARTCRGSLLVLESAWVSVIYLLARVEDQERVLRQVLRWCHAYDRAGGAEDLRWVGRMVALAVSGLAPDLDDDVPGLRTLASRFPDIVRDLVWLVLRDRHLGQVGIDSLEQRCRHVDLDALTSGRKAKARRAELVRLTRIITPDLRWWARRKAVSTLIRKHPGKARVIRYIFRTAARAQKLESTPIPVQAGSSPLS